MNCSGGVPRACVKANPDDPNLCLYAEYAALTMATPTFSLQATYDAWQIPNDLRVPLNDTVDINAWGAGLEVKMNLSLASNPEHGVFWDSCYHHCGEWGSITIDGQQQGAALVEWYNGIGVPGSKKMWRQGKTYPCPACCSP
jgi:hypothetical protein